MKLMQGFLNFILGKATEPVDDKLGHEVLNLYIIGHISQENSRIKIGVEISRGTVYPVMSSYGDVWITMEWTYRADDTRSVLLGM